MSHLTKGWAGRSCSADSRSETRRALPWLAAALSVGLLTACGLTSNAVEFRSATRAPSDHELLLVTETCNATVGAEVQETESTITITLTAEDNTQGDCRDLTRVQLDDPIGDRVLIDGSRDEPVPVKTPD